LLRTPINALKWRLPPMSIYQPRFKRQFNDDEVTLPVLRGTHKSVPRTPAGADSEEDWSRVRKATPVNYLLPKSIEWLTSLPSDVRPMALVIQYPRIANVFALHWSNPATCRAHFDVLLVDHHGKRKGFPADVYRDLWTLRDYYYSCF
jgi:hypothetical protein